MIAPDRQTRQRDTSQEWHSAARVAPLWAAKAGKSLLQKVTAANGEGRFFDDAGKLRSGASELFHQVGSSDLYRVAAPISDREESNRPFEENVWVRAGIKAISEGMVRLPLQIFPSAPDTGVEPLASHPLLDLLEDPNRVMTPTQFWRAHAINMKHDGECVWFMMDENGEPVQSNPQTRVLSQLPVTVLPVRGSLVEVQYDDGGMPYSYRYTTSYSRHSSKVSPAFPVGSVVHYRDYDPYNFARGLGDVASLERETDLYFQAFRSMDASVRNGGDPGGFIIYDHEVDAAEMQRRQELADEEFSGANQRRVKLLQSSAKFVPNPVKPSDMQYQTLLTWLRDSILAGLGVPPPCVGVYDNATYNNVETAYRELWTGPNGILSLANSTADVLTNDLLPRMLRVGSQPGAVAHFDSSHIEQLQQDVGDQLERAANISSMGIGVTYNEVLEQQGTEVPQPDEGDRKWGSPSLTDLDAPEPVEEQAAPSGSSEASRTAMASNGGESCCTLEEEPLSERSGQMEQGEGTAADVAVALARRDGPVPYDEKLHSLVLDWLSRYEAAQIRKLKGIASGSFRRLSVFDETVNPGSVPEEVWAALLLNQDKWAEELDQAVRAQLSVLMAESAAEAAKEVGAAIISSQNPQAIKALATQVINLSEGVASTTTRRVRNHIAEVFVKTAPPGTLREVIAQSLPELTAELKAVFKNKAARARTIAQTETGAAVNNGRFIQYEASNVEEIQWVSSVDGAVRFSHLSANGEVRRMGDPFPNGLRYPHDPQGKASEVINCRCSFQAVKRFDPLDDPDIEIS